MSEELSAPPRIRLTGLQEAQLPALVEIDRRCAEMYYAIGFDGAEVPLRSESEIAALTRRHDVRIAEADHVVAGYMAWRDEAPGVAYLEELSVDPDHQRLGIGRRLIEALWEGARAYGIGHVVLRAWLKAGWAQAFYKKLGFAPIGDDAPERVVGWRREREASGRPLVRPGEVLLWAAVPPAPAPAPDADADDGADADGEGAGSPE